MTGSEKLEGVVVIPTSWTTMGLSGREWAILVVLAKYRNRENGLSWPSAALIARDAEIPRNHVHRILARFRQDPDGKGYAHLISFETAPDGKTPAYRLHGFTASTQRVLAEAEASAKRSTQRVLDGDATRTSDGDATRTGEQYARRTRNLDIREPRDLRTSGMNLKGREAAPAAAPLVSVPTPQKPKKTRERRPPSADERALVMLIRRRREDEFGLAWDVQDERQELAWARRLLAKGKTLQAVKASYVRAIAHPWWGAVDDHRRFVSLRTLFQKWDQFAPGGAPRQPTLSTGLRVVAAAGQKADAPLAGDALREALLAKKQAVG